MGTYFGTDGIRGVAGELLTPEFAVQVGRAAAVVLAQKAGSHPLFVIGRDTRLSGPMLEAALTAGLTSGGARVEIAGVIPTPGLATLVRQRGADAGVCATLVDQRGEPRRRDHAGDLHARAATGEAGRESRFEHRPRQARVAADDEQRVRTGLLRHHHRRGPPDLYRELGGEQLAGYAADAVGAEVGAHGETDPYARGW